KLFLLNIASSSTLPCLGISGPTSDECTLTSPDLGLLKLASPELERLVLASAHSVFSTVSTPTSTVHVGTNEQEGFAAGFMLALAELQEKTTSEDGRMMGVSTEEELDSMPSVGPALESVRPGNPQNSSSGEAQNCSLATQASLLNLNRDRQSVKEEPQRVPEAGEYGPLLSPTARERARAERKRLRNRVAASKCRKKKLERIARLEEKVRWLMCKKWLTQSITARMNHINSLYTTGLG
uniref:Jun proto-oncogene, AP-1 transcription factor subunit n=1 Tax=Eptatretus burgeri TaxID=7764 RepID=A0A8C4QA20_EPTBU